MIKIADELTGVRTVAIAGHIRPDGDCVGSCMGMYHYLKENFPDIHVDVYLEAIPSVFSYIKDVDVIRHTYEPQQPYDLFISQDAADKERLGFAIPCFDTAVKTICIDHHISNTGFAQINYIYPTASSTSELVFDLLDCERISAAGATALYTGIVHDTGVFQYTCTSPKTMAAAGQLMAKGIPFTKIIEESFYQKTYVQNQILGRALLESILLLEGKCIVPGVSKKELDFYHAGSEDLEGIVSQLRNTKGVEVAIFLYELNTMQYKVSMRSNGKVNVSEVAAYFGGGGHILAAGCSMHGTMHDTINNLARQIEKQL